jgi:hypothetical protein
MNAAPRLIPARPRIDPSGEYLEWDPYSDRARDWAPSAPPTDLLDAIAVIARPWTPAWRRARIVEIAKEQGPLTRCTCSRDHGRLRWQMEPPVRRPPWSRELVKYWIDVSLHVNALRRLMADLAARPGRPDDWDTVWPDRPGGRQSTHPDPDLIAADGLERPGDLFGDVSWERRQIARHLESWVGSFHSARAVRWEGGRRSVTPTSTGLLGELGNLLVDAFEREERIRVCTGTVHDQPCRITWSIQRDKPRQGGAPPLCGACLVLYHQRKEPPR